MNPQTDAIVKACKEQASSCQYTAAALYHWLRAAVWANRLWNALPVVFGALATFSIIADGYPILSAILALLAGLLPSIYEKLELQTHTDEILSQAGQYKNLEHSFSNAASITSLDPNSQALKTEFDSLMRRMEELRARPLPIPTKHFMAGRQQIKAGHYEPDTV